MVRPSSPDPLPVDGTFALLLTHDVDRPYKSLQAPYYAVADRDPRHLRALRSDVNPWWTFDDLLALEADLGVRSAFYFLQERGVRTRRARDWLRPHYWIEHLGRYDLDAPDVRSLVRRLDDGGWEVGLHGSYDLDGDPERLDEELSRLESVLGDEVVGGRRHHLNISIPDTWREQADAGLRYDTSLGTSDAFGFHFGFREFRPFDDEFVVFPLTLMERALPDPDDRFEAALDDCRRLLETARERRGVMTVLWHPRVFASRDFPGYRRLYRRLIEEAQALDAWIGPPAALYERLAAARTDRDGATLPVGGR